MSWDTLTSLDLYITYRCNRRCTTCFIGDEQLDSAEEMQWSYITELTAWAESIPTIEEVVLLGGEPTLHSRFSDIVELLSSTRLAVRLVTNGNARARKLLHSTLHTLAGVHVSIDGSYENLNDETRGKGAFRDAIKAAGVIAHAGVPLTVNCTPSPNHLDDLPNMVTLACSLGAETLNIHWPSVTGKCSEERSITSPETWLQAEQDTLAAIRQDESEIRLRWQPAYTDVPLHAACVLKSRSNLEVFPNRSAYFCGLLVDQPQTSFHIWRGLEPIERPNSLEAQLYSNPCPCPARPSDETAAYHPVCIFYRRDYTKGRLEAS
jgi:MoaA/NifB/PqqE/SkfB family radical SAM enzyme